MVPSTAGTLTLYLGFSLLVIALLAVDIIVLKSQGTHRVRVKEAAAWSVAWITLSFTFCGLLWWYLDEHSGRELANEKALEYLTGYLIEKSLAVDNVFVWITLFNYFAVPAELQKRVLLYGVLGAIIMRATLIYAGAFLLANFHWILYVFGLSLLITGVKMLLFAKREPDLDKNPILRWMRGHVRISNKYHGEKFLVTIEGIRYVTPLFVVLVMIEVTDIIFSIDSIPAIFAVTDDPFIVFTSNIFAIMGLRAMYFLLSDIAERFHLLKYGLAIILMFIGVKMLLFDLYNIPVGVALGVVALILLTSVAASLVTSNKTK